MSHFRPICLMPLSVSNNADRIVSVPPLRQKNAKKDILKIYKPIKTKFRKKLTSVRRRSAFVIFQAIKPLFNAGKFLKGDGSKATISKPILAAADSQANDMAAPESSDSFDGRNATPEIQNDTTTTAATTTTNNGRSQKCAKTVQTRKMSKTSSCDSTKARSNRDKMLQEKEDFQLAKMLQECVGTSDAPSRYSLRSRNKSSVSSLSSSTSSSQDLFQSKGFTIGATPKFKKSMSFNDNTKDLIAATGSSATRSQRNTNDSNDKFIDFSFQKLTRSRRIAMTMSGV